MKKKTAEKLERKLTKTLLKFFKKNPIQNATVVGTLELVRLRFMLGKL